MHKRYWMAGLTVLLMSGAVFASIDLSDFDKNTMEDVDGATKDLESALRGRESAAAVASAEFIRDSMQWAEGYFEKKPAAADAVKLARESREFSAAIAKAAASGDFRAADEAYTSLKRSCKSCHDVYKPPEL